MFRAIPSLKAVDGHRKTTGVLYPYEPDIGGDENTEYKVDEEWFRPEIFKSNVGATLFVT